MNQTKIKPKVYKPVFLLLFFFFLSISVAFSQKKKCIIFFKDGTTVEGLGKIKSDNFIKFKVSEDAESTNYDPATIDKIKINENGLTQTYKYKKEKGYMHIWLKVVVEGKVNLYKNDISGFYFGPATAPGGFGGGMGMGMSSGPVVYFYVSRQDDPEVSIITSLGNISKNFKKTAGNFFKDCPVLVEKINDKIYKRDDVEDVVNFYNKKCGDAVTETATQTTTSSTN